MIPDFFSDDYHDKLAAAINRVDGMELPNMLAGRVCNHFIRQVFSADLVPRSKSLVANVRKCMQEVVSEVCDRVCKEYPTLLKVLKITVLDEFMDEMETETEQVVTTVCQAEYDWPFTQDPAYMDSLQGVHQAVMQNIRHQNGAAAVGRIPKSFIKKIQSTGIPSGDSVHNLQVIIDVDLSISRESVILSVIRVVLAWQRIVSVIIVYNKFFNFERIPYHVSHQAVTILKLV